jgi:hypothetical protein
MTRRNAIVIAAVTLLALGCALSYRLEMVENWTWPSAEISRLQIRTQNGELQLTAAADTIITAEITRRCQGIDSSDAESAIKNVVVTDSSGAGELFLKATMPELNTRSYGAAFALALPDTVHFVLGTSNGDITITGMVDGGSISTSNGAITLAGTRGSITATTSNGVVTVKNHSGGLDITSTNGAVTCSDTALASTDSIALKTSNGAVTLYLPVSVSAHFDASTSNGEVSLSGFPSVSYTRTDNTHKMGDIGGGACSVTITTSNGAVSIVAQ